MRTPDSQARYAAFKARDARFDGRFFVGVSSTGIYCRPVCTAKLPKEENCVFYDSAAAAEQAGFRPCLMCRPELAPGAAPIDATSALAHRAARLLEENCGSGLNISELVDRLGCSDRHLRRAFATEFSVSPVRYLQTYRLLLAKNLLTDSDLPILDVAMAAGFGSLRRFNALFKQQYRMPPSALRKPITPNQCGHVTLTLGYRPPYQWEHMLAFLQGRAIPGVEAVRDGAYLRTVRCERERASYCGWLRAEPNPRKNALTLCVSSSLLPVLPQVIARVRNLFDLLCLPDAVWQTLQGMNDIKPGLAVPGTRLPGCFEPFEMTVRAVLGQQISVKAAGTLAGRIAHSLGAPLDTGIAELTHTFPTAEDILALPGNMADHLGPLGVTGKRAVTISALARALLSGEINLTRSAQPEAEVRKLLAIPGIGAWTAQYIAMRAMGWPDAFPHTDYGVRKALAPLSDSEILHVAEAWRPWRAYATINLWKSL